MSLPQGGGSDFINIVLYQKHLSSEDPPLMLSGARNPYQIGLRKKMWTTVNFFSSVLSNKSIFRGLICYGKFGYIYYLFLDYSDKFLCIISVPNFKDENVPKFHVGNVPKFHIGNVPDFEVGNVPNFKLGNCIQSIITPTGGSKS